MTVELMVLTMAEQLAGLKVELTVVTLVVKKVGSLVVTMVAR